MGFPVPPEQSSKCLEVNKNFDIGIIGMRRTDMIREF